jgi:maleate isomerase
MAGPIKLGVIVPSSNTALEPLTHAIVASISTPERPITVHFTRIPVTQLNMSAGSNLQFSHETLLAAGRLLVDAKVSVLGSLHNQSVPSRNGHLRLGGETSD